MPLGIANFPGSLDVHATDGTAIPETFAVVPRLFYGSITAAITNSGTTLTLPDTSPLSTKGVIVVENETMVWTSKPTGTTLVVVRGQFGSTAVAHALGAPFGVVITAGQFNAHAKAITELQKKLGIGSSNQAAISNTVLAGDGAGQSSWRQIVAADFLDTVTLKKIADVTLGAAAATIDIQSIPSTFKHLLITHTLRGTTAAGSAGQKLTINNDTGSNYDRQYIYANTATTVIAGEGIGDAVGTTLIGMTGASAAANQFGSGFIFFFDYANTSHHKSMHMFAGAYDTVAPLVGMATQHMLWRNTAAINRLTFVPASGNYDVGSRITLYGLPT